ncbi:MAG: uncharacterized protein JWR88_1674 [Pseudonocardia sp.]|jgi:hypothetical protein|nr:uncharacterized protein [Pseudonocardia sp.]
MTIEHTDYAPVLTEQPALARQDTLLARATGYDVAAAATNTGLVISAQAIDPGRSYDTRLSYLTADGKSSEVAGGRVDAESAPQALTLLIGNERRSGGLDLVDVAALEEQLTQLDAALHASQPKTTHVVEDVNVAPTQQVTVVSDDPAQRWAGVAREAGGQAVLEDLGWPGLAAGLDRAEAAGWDVATNLPRLVQQDEVPDRHPARELYYRLMNDCEAAMPPVPTVADINGTAPVVTTEARQRAELSMPQQSHAVGRQMPGR